MTRSEQQAATRNARELYDESWNEAGFQQAGDAILRNGHVEITNVNGILAAYRVDGNDLERLTDDELDLYQAECRNKPSDDRLGG
jgi:hypothetical protein